MSTPRTTPQGKTTPANRAVLWAVVEKAWRTGIASCRPCLVFERAPRADGGRAMVAIARRATLATLPAQSTDRLQAALLARQPERRTNPLAAFVSTLLRRS